MTSTWILGGAVFGLLFWGLHLPAGTAAILTVVIVVVLMGRGLFTRRSNKVIIVQDITTGRTEYQPMDAAAYRYLNSRGQDINEGMGG